MEGCTTVIQPLFDGMLAILLAKFFINDLPHAAGLTGTDYERPPTAGQLRYIAILCQQLKMPVPYEERVKTFGEAGRMIRELEAEKKHRRAEALRTKRHKPPPRRISTATPAKVRPPPGKPPAKKALPVPVSASFRIERTTTDKVIDDLERTWRRIESDMSTRMQSALGILKNIMGLYFEEPAVVAWDNTDLVGIVLYRTAHDVDLQIQETNITELASFTHEPGVGGLLVGEVIKIAGEAGSDTIRVRHGPGARGFYEKLGFTADVQHPEIPTLMVYRLKSSNPGTTARKTRIWVGISPGSWGGSLKESAPRKSYLVDSVTEAITSAKQDPYFQPWFDKIRTAGYKKMSFVWGTSEPTVHRHSTASFDVPFVGGSDPGTAAPVVGFTGTRRGMTLSQKTEVKSILASLQPRLVRHGDCVGADAEFHAISMELGIPVWLHPCTLSEQRAYSQGAIGSEPPKEPLERNKDIVNMSDVLIAAPGEAIEVLRSGTWATIRYARKASRKLLVIYPKGSHEGSNPTNYYRIFIPVESASVSPGSLYWRSAEFRFEETFIQTTYTEIASTPKVASTRYIYSLPEKDIPTEVYAENIKDSSDNGRYSGPQLKEEIVQGVAAEGYRFIERLKSGNPV